MALRNRARTTRLLVVSLVSAALVTITVDYRQGDSGPLASAGDAALTLIAPLQEAVSKVTDPIGEFFSTLVHLPSIRNDRDELARQLDRARQEMAVERADQNRLNELEALLGLQESFGPSVDTTAAQVIGHGASNFEWTITVDKGSSDGIEVDMPVVASAGLVGHVIHVTANSSEVQLIIDPQSFVGGRLDVSEEIGMVEGEGEGDLRMGLVDPDTPVEPDEHVVTAGFRFEGVAQSLYPPNILIGTVSRVLEDDSALQKFVTIRPAVDFSTLDLVLVVLSNGSG